MRKRSRYRPKPIILNTIGFVIESMTPVAQHGSYLLDLKIKNHDAMDCLRRGVATRANMDCLIQMNNMTEALWRLGFGKEYAEILFDGFNTLKIVGGRFARDGRVTLYPKELNALNLYMELHDAQMDVVTIRDVERAVRMVRSDIQQGRAEKIKTAQVNA